MLPRLEHFVSRELLLDCTKSKRYDEPAEAASVVALQSATLAIVTRNCKWQVARAEHLHGTKRRDAEASDKFFMSIIW